MSRTRAVFEKGGDAGIKDAEEIGSWREQWCDAGRYHVIYAKGVNVPGIFLYI